MAAENPQYTLWLDCEFTGLSASDDLLLEVGAVVTKGLFDEIASYQAVVAHDPSLIAIRMEQDDWWSSRPAHRDKLLTEAAHSILPLGIVDSELTAFACNYFVDPIVPAGNSMGTDRLFIARCLPNFNALLHYRTIDVSSLKEIARYFNIEEFEKTEQHRVLADIHESIEELRYLLSKLGAPAVRDFLG